MATPNAYASRAPFKESVIYQIYPASFYDSNNDGYGDLNGIRAKLDYLQSLGADVLWLSPIYKSPLKDMGYDISDYKAIDERYGTLKDWDGLVAELHGRNMKLMMDLVVNHTSDQHEWFLASRASKHNNPKRDWYIWRPPKYSADGSRLPPNNWVSEFGGSAWEWNEHTQEYYLHLYAREQPDLNWENSEVREAVWEMMLWWLERGADGFRMDVINLISKTPGLPDGPVIDPSKPFQRGRAHYVNGPKVHEYIQEMNRRVLSYYPSAITVGESPFSHNAGELIKYVHPSRKELHMIFQFELATLDADASSTLIPAMFTLPALKRIISKWQRYMHENGGWNTLYLENHDLARSVSRFLGFRSDADAGLGNAVEKTRALRARGAKLLAILQTTQGGTLYVYQGQELGLANVPRSWSIEEYKDVATVNFYNEMVERKSKGLMAPGMDMSAVMDGINKKARDNARTPMHWDGTPHAGFTAASVQPWMRVNDDYPTWNAAAQVGEKDSVHTFWKSAISLRKSHLVLTYGDFVLLSPEHESIFAYTRTLEGVTALIIMNFSKEEVRYEDAIAGEAKKALLVQGNLARDSVEIELSGFVVVLEPYEGRVYLTKGVQG